jgi:hypothetical protein
LSEIGNIDCESRAGATFVAASSFRLPRALEGFLENTGDLQWKIGAACNVSHCKCERSAARARTMESNGKYNGRAMETGGNPRFDQRPAVTPEDRNGAAREAPSGAPCFVGGGAGSATARAGRTVRRTFCAGSL